MSIKSKGLSEHFYSHCMNFNVFKGTAVEQTSAFVILYMFYLVEYEFPIENYLLLSCYSYRVRKCWFLKQRVEFMWPNIILTMQILPSCLLCSQPTGTFRPHSFHPKSEASEGNHALKSALSQPLDTKRTEFSKEEFQLEHHSLFKRAQPVPPWQGFVLTAGACHGNTQI